MSIFRTIIAWIMTAFAFLFPWFNKEAKPVPVQLPAANTCTVSDKTLTVALSANPTTGYSWDYDITGDGIAFQESKYMSSAADSDQPLCGAGGVTQFIFSAKSEGTFKIVLTYLRSWDDSSVCRTVTIEGHTGADGTVTVDRSSF